MSDKTVYPTSDPKYAIQNNRLVNATTLEPIPLDEPIFIFRAKDNLATGGLEGYDKGCEAAGVSIVHRKAVQSRIEEFDKFSSDHPERMKFPDTSFESLKGNCYFSTPPEE